MQVYSQFFSNGGQGWVLKLLITLSALFTLFSVIMLGMLLYLRFYKNFRSRKKKKQENLLIEFINSYLFDENFDRHSEAVHFKQEHLNTSLEKKIALKNILIYNENFKGESSLAIKQLFAELGLENTVMANLKNGRWYEKARAIYILSQVAIHIEKTQLNILLNHRRHEVREQALLHYIKLSDDNPLDFLDNIERPLTLWLQIFIENALKYTYKGPIPDFSRWLDHPLTSVGEFAIKMIAEYNQFENLLKLEPFLYHYDESLKKETIRSFVKMGYDEAISLVIPIFANQSPTVKKEILKMVRHLGTYNQLIQFASQINENEPDVKISYLIIEKALR